MKVNSKICIVWMVVLMIGLNISCTKEGDVGPRGEQGVEGVDGEDGTRIYTGNGAPSTDIGNVGDFYFRTSNANFYGPKTESGWGVPVSLRGAAGAPGPQGPTGSAGSRIHSGTAIPAGGLGAAGDFYFRTNTADFYGPKTGTNWGTPINLKGVKGDDGNRIYSGTTVPTTSLGSAGDFYFRTTTSDFYGPKTASGWGSPTNLRGATGTTGAQGPAGTPGSRIHSGTAVPGGTLGIVGDFYFRTSTGDFYGPKTGTNWGTPINLKGVKGDDGNRIYSGTTVPVISLGAVGDFYFRTTTGDFYGPKTTSSWGTPTSLRGATGPQGPAGTAGSRIHSGTAVPATSLGVVGDFYLRTSNAMLYGPKTASGWGTPVNLRGPAGPAGPQGPPGSANVIYSDWITPSCDFCNQFDMVTPQLTQAIFDQGQISVYVRYYSFDLDAYVIAPLTSSVNETYHYIARVGRITVTASTLFARLGAAEFRYVLIPGSVLASGGLNSNKNIDFQDFAKVKAAFNIPD